MSQKRVSFALWAFTGLNIGIQGWLCVRWVSLHGFIGGIVYWLGTARQDPILAAAVIDFILVIAIVGLWLLREIPPPFKRRPVFFVWCAVYLVWPSIGLLLYLTWIRPRILRHPAS